MLNHADACSSDEVEWSHARLIKRPLGGKKREVGVDTTPSSSSILEINLEFPRCSSRRAAALLESGSNRRTTVTTALSQVGGRTRNQTLVLHTATRLTATDRSSRA